MAVCLLSWNDLTLTIVKSTYFMTIYGVPVQMPNQTKLLQILQDLFVFRKRLKMSWKSSKKKQKPIFIAWALDFNKMLNLIFKLVYLTFIQKLKKQIMLQW